MQQVLEPLDDRDRLARQAGGVASRVHGRHVPEAGAYGRDRVLGKSRLNGRQEPHGHTRQRGVDTRFMEGQPDRNAHPDVERGPPNTDPLQHHDEEDERDGDDERSHGDTRRVGRDEHDERAEVVGNGQGEQEEPQRRGDASTEERHDTEREGDVGGHGDAPAPRAAPACIHDEIEQGGHEHAARGSQDGQRGPPTILQLARRQLAADLQPDHEEEDGHQSLVDPESQRAVDRVPADTERQVRGPERPVARLPGRVRPHQRNRGGPKWSFTDGPVTASPPLASVAKNSRTGRATVLARAGVVGGRSGRDLDQREGVTTGGSWASTTGRRPVFPAHPGGEGRRRRPRLPCPPWALASPSSAAAVINGHRRS